MDYEHGGKEISSNSGEILESKIRSCLVDPLDQHSTVKGFSEFKSKANPDNIFKVTMNVPVTIAKPTSIGSTFDPQTTIEDL